MFNLFFWVHPFSPCKHGAADLCAAGGLCGPSLPAALRAHGSASAAAWQAAKGTGRSGAVGNHGDISWDIMGYHGIYIYIYLYNWYIIYYNLGVNKCQ